MLIRTPLKIFVTIVLVIFIILGIFISKAGVRGTDQYWYVADTESLMYGNGVQTNNILPYNIVNDTTVNSKGFIHNVPSVYLAVIPGLFFGAFYGWLIMNTILNLVTAFLLFLTLRKFLDSNLSSLIALLYLVMPLTFWLSYQPLTEAFHAFLLMSVLYIYYRTDSIIRYLYISILVVVLTLCRNNYMLVPLIISVVFYLEIDKRNKRLYSLLLLLFVFGLSFSFKSFFPDTWNFSFYDTIVTEKVGVLDSSTIGPLVKLYLKESILFLKEQFVPNDFTVAFYIPFDFFVLSALILWFKKKDKKPMAPLVLVLTSIVFLFITAVIFQNQARYMLPLYPLVIVAFYVLLKNNFKNEYFYNLNTVLLIGSIILCLGADSIITYKAVEDGNSQKEIRDYYSDEYQKIIPANESVIFSTSDSSYNYIMHGYILRPRKVFIVDENKYLLSGQYDILIRDQNIKWLITKRNHSQKMNYPNYTLQFIKQINDFNNSEFNIYKILRDIN